MAYCLYLRKSRTDLEAEMHGEGETLARHEKALLDFANRHELQIGCIYREIVSGETIAARPVMQQLLTEVGHGIWDGVLVMEIERLARGDTIDQGIVAQTFQLSDTKIITPLKSYDPSNEFDQEYFEFGLFMSRREYKTINRRLQNGRTASVKEGKYVGSKPPYGYVRKRIEHDKGFTLEPDPQQASIVKLIFELYAHGELRPDATVQNMGITKIAEKLNRLKIPTVKGGKWSNSTLQNILQNPVYVGKIRWNARPVQKKMSNGCVVKKRPRAKPEQWLLVDGLHEPLVDVPTWELVQKRIAEMPSLPCSAHTSVKNPLAGLVFCGICGRRMVRRPYSSRNVPATLICPSACHNISSSLELVESRILAALGQWLENYLFTPKNQEGERLCPQIPLKQNALETLEKERLNRIKQQSHIYELLEQGIYSEDVFLTRMQANKEKLDAAQNTIALMQEEITNEEHPARQEADILPVSSHVLAEYTSAESAEEKNDLLKALLCKVIYTKTVNGRWHGNADDFELILYPKLPKNNSGH